MDGIQKAVHDGLIYLAGKVANGAYGADDNAFQDAHTNRAFLEDVDNNVIDVMQ